jgi:DNA-binding beta-propeller fold protein YncE
MITRQGRILLARMLHGDLLAGLTHCALGDGDASYVDPLHPPLATADQTALCHERVRKAADRWTYLEEDAAGTLVVNGVAYREATEPTPVLGVFFHFDEAEANGFPIKEYGFFGGGVTYAAGVAGAMALDGVYDAESNPDGQVLVNLPGVSSNSSGIALGPDGRIWVAGTNRGRVLRFTATGQPDGEFTGENGIYKHFDQPIDVAVAPDGTAYVVDLSGRVVQLDAAGKIAHEWPVEAGRNR